MDNKGQPFEKIEKRIWEMVLLAIVVILFLTLSLLGLQFYHYLEKSNSLASIESSYKYVVFLTIVILLFCSYMVAQHRRLSQLTKSFLKEKEAVAMLNQDVKALGSLLEVSANTSSQKKLSAILTTITKEIISCFDADHASVLLLNENAETIETKVSVGKNSDIVQEAVIRVGESIAGRVVEDGRPMLLNGKVDPKNFKGTQNNHRNITSSMCVPLKIDNQSIGVLNLNLLDRDRKFTTRDLRLIEVFANNAAVAINDARLYKQITSFNEQLEQKVRDRTRELETANRIKSDFLSSISHELRTPLNAIVGFSKVLLEQNFGPLDKQQQKYVQNIADSGQRLDAIINDILDGSKLEAGYFKLNIQPVKVQVLMDNVMAKFKDEFREKKSNLKLEIPSELIDQQFKADQKKLEQVIGNLISNAVKFTPDNSLIALAVNCVPASEVAVAESEQNTTDKLLEISVSDTGIGISPEKQKYIFKDFYQIKGGITGKSIGTGMGLSLTKRLVELHGGMIRVESEGQGKGSRFVVLIPFKD
jgi:signal transduction histidine kinase